MDELQKLYGYLNENHSDLLGGMDEKAFTDKFSNTDKLGKLHGFLSESIPDFIADMRQDQFVSKFGVKESKPNPVFNLPNKISPDLKTSSPSVEFEGEVPEEVKNPPKKKEDEKPDYQMEVSIPGMPYTAVHWGQARKLKKKRLEEQKEEERQERLSLGEEALATELYERQGDWSLTGEELAARRRAENPDPDYKYEQDRASKRTTWIEKMSEEGLNLGELPEQNTMAEYKMRIGDIQENIDRLVLAKDYLENTIKEEGKGELFESYKADIAKMYELQGMFNRLSPEDKSMNAIIQEAQILEEQIEAVEAENPEFRELALVNQGIGNNVGRAQEILASDNFRVVQRALKNKKALQAVKDKTGYGLFGSDTGTEFGMKIAAKLLGNIGAAMDSAENAGAVRTAAQATGIPFLDQVTGKVADAFNFLNGKDEKYNAWDIAEDFLIDLDKNLELVAPTSSNLTRGPITKTADWTAKNGKEYQVDLDAKGNIRAIRDEKGMIADVDPSQISDEELEELDAKANRLHFNTSAFLYQGAKTIADFGIQIALTKGLAGKLAPTFGANAAGSISTTAVAGGMMYESLYEEGLEMFDGDKDKALQFATTAAAGIGASANLFGLESKLTGFGKGWMDDVIKSTKRSARFRDMTGLSAFERGWLKTKAVNTQGFGETFEETLLEPLIQGAVGLMVGNTPDLDFDGDDYREWLTTGITSFAVGLLGGLGNVDGEIQERESELISQAYLMATEDVDNFATILRNKLSNGEMGVKFDSDAAMEKFITAQTARVAILKAQLDAAGSEPAMREELAPLLLKRQHLNAALSAAQDPNTGNEQKAQGYELALQNNATEINKITKKYADQSKENEEQQASEVPDVQGQPAQQQAEVQAEAGVTQQEDTNQEAPQVSLFLEPAALEGKRVHIPAIVDGQLTTQEADATEADQIYRANMDKVQALKNCR